MSDVLDYLLNRLRSAGLFPFVLFGCFSLNHIHRAVIRPAAITIMADMGITKGSLNIPINCTWLSIICSRNIEVFMNTHERADNTRLPKRKVFRKDFPLFEWRYEINAQTTIINPIIIKLFMLSSFGLL